MSLHDEIKQVAHELYEKSGRIGGRDQENWIEAERIVTERHKAAAAATENKEKAATVKPVKKAAPKPAAKKTTTKAATKTTAKAKKTKK